METFSYYTRIYFLIISQYIKARMHYRMDFILSTFGMLLINIAGVFSLWIIFTSISELVGWRYEELVFIYAFSLLAIIPLQLFFDNIWVLRIHLIEGTFIKYYFRPLNMMFYYMSETFDIKGLGQLVFAVGALIWSSTVLCLKWTVLKCVLFFVLLFSSSLVMLSIMILAAVTGFWVRESFGVMMLANKSREFARYPLGIYNRPFRFLFTYVIPIGFIASYPSELFLRPSQVNFHVYFAPVVGILMFWMSYQFWKKGVHKYDGTAT